MIKYKLYNSTVIKYKLHNKTLNKVHISLENACLHNSCRDEIEKIFETKLYKGVVKDIWVGETLVYTSH